MTSASVNQSGDPIGEEIVIVCNGEQRLIASGLSVAALISVLGLDQDMMAVELDGRVVPRSDYENTILTAGNHLELLRFVGGG